MADLHSWGRPFLILQNRRQWCAGASTSKGFSQFGVRVELSKMLASQGRP
jgi:hypothetical protein